MKSVLSFPAGAVVLFSRRRHVTQARRFEQHIRPVTQRLSVLLLRLVFHQLQSFGAR